MDRRRALGIGLVVVAGASFASGSIFATLSYREGLDWLTLLGWRFLIGAGLAWAWVALSPSRRGSVRGLTRRQLAVTLALGAVYTGNAGTYYAGIETIPASLAGVIVYIYPVFVALLSLRFATRLPGRRPWFALALAVVGIVLALGGVDVSADLPIQGILLILASAAIYSVWIVLSARLSGERRDRLGSDVPADATAARDAAGTTAVMMTRDGPRLRVDGRDRGCATRPADGPLGRLAVPGRHRLPRLVPGDPDAVCRGSRIGAAQAALVSTTEPVFIVVLSFVILDQRLAPIQLVGAGLILVGVIIAQTSPRPRGAPEPATPLEAEVEG